MYVNPAFGCQILVKWLIEMIDWIPSCLHSYFRSLISVSGLKQLNRQPLERVINAAAWVVIVCQIATSILTHALATEYCTDSVFYVNRWNIHTEQVDDVFESSASRSNAQCDGTLVLSHVGLFDTQHRQHASSLRVFMTILAAVIDVDLVSLSVPRHRVVGPSIVVSHSALELNVVVHSLCYRFLARHWTWCTAFTLDQLLLYICSSIYSILWS